MVKAFLVAALSFQQVDSVTFQDAATANLYALARQRHIHQDTLVRDYQASVLTRLEASAGKSRFARQTTLMAHETMARITWKRPNDLKIQVLGTRAKVPLVAMLSGLANVDSDVEDELRNELVMDRPWFIPRAFGDSIRVMGVPEHAALHPLAAGATDYYRFAITDSVEVRIPGRVVCAKAITVEPKRFGPALVAGTMWVDAQTGDVVRMRVLFLGDYLWEKPDDPTPEDSAEAKRSNDEAKKYLTVEAEVEYALINQEYWMPYRQFLGITAEIPMFLNMTIPARAVTTFSDYEVNVDPELVFAIPEDELERDGRARRQLQIKQGDGMASDPDADRPANRRETEKREKGYYHASTWNDGQWEIDVPRRIHWTRTSGIRNFRPNSTKPNKNVFGRRLPISHESRMNSHRSGRGSGVGDSRGRPRQTSSVSTVCKGSRSAWATRFGRGAFPLYPSLDLPDSVSETSDRRGRSSHAATGRMPESI